MPLKVKKLQDFWESWVQNSEEWSHFQWILAVFPYFNLVEEGDLFKRLHGKFGEICMFAPVCWRGRDGLWGKIASHPNFDSWTAPYCLRMLGCLGTGHPDFPQGLKMVFVSSNRLHPSKKHVACYGDGQFHRRENGFVSSWKLSYVPPGK